MKLDKLKLRKLKTVKAIFIYAISLNQHSGPYITYQIYMKNYKFFIYSV